MQCNHFKWDKMVVDLAILRRFKMNVELNAVETGKRRDMQRDMFILKIDNVFIVAAISLTYIDIPFHSKVMSYVVAQLRR